MSHSSQPDESRDRCAAMLRTAMGPAIAQALADPLVVEVMVNPDGVLRLDRLGEGRTQTDVSLTPGEVERVIRLVASHMRLAAPRDRSQRHRFATLQRITTMPELKLEKLPDRTPVKLSIVISPDLDRRLQDYAGAYKEAYGDEEKVADLVPFMLQKFLEGVRRISAPHRHLQDG